MDSLQKEKTYIELPNMVELNEETNEDENYNKIKVKSNSLEESFTTYHIINASQNKQEDLSCHLCHKNFTNTFDFDFHGCFYSDNKKYKCEICKKGFDSVKLLEKHTYNHSGHAPYKCNVCKMEFVKESKFKMHMLNHEVEEEMVCNECGADFGSVESLKKHKQLHAEKEVECFVCHKMFYSIQVL